MSKLENYNPLQLIKLPEAEIAPCNGIIVVVGPNSSGKSLFLRDVASYLNSGIGKFVVCDDIHIAKPADPNQLWDDLISQRYIKPHPSGGIEFQIYVPHVSEITHGPQGRDNRVTFNKNGFIKACNALSPGNHKTSEAVFGPIGMTLFAFLSLNERRQLCGSAASFNYQTQIPSYPVQGLFVNTSAKDVLADETGKVFGNAVWLDSSENGIYQLRATGAKKLPSHGTMSNPFEASRFRKIEEEGDGMRSYVGICISLLLASRPVSMIDEPELCLHPPQAYHMGRFIGRYARKDHSVFVATHSSHILRGILETGENITVIRMARVDGKFTARIVAENELVDNLRNPRTRAESILDGMFSKGVVLVESDGDREEYLAAAEAIDDYPSREIHFAPVGGNGGFADPLRFYRSLRIPCAIIADADTLCDTDKILGLIDQLVTDETKRGSLKGEVRNLVQRIKALTPSITEQQVKDRLRVLSERQLDWANDDDNVLRREMNQLERQIKRVRALKEGGVAAYKEHADIHSDLEKTFAELAAVGLFLVPVGELEDWVPNLMTTVPKGSKSKTERASIAARLIREAPNKSGDIWEFVKRVFDFVIPS